MFVSKKVIPPLYSAMVSPGLLRVQFWALWHKRDMGIMERVQQKATKKMKGQKHFRYKERLRELGLFSLEQWALIPDVGSDRHSQTLLSGVQWQDRSQQTQTEKQEIPLKQNKNIFYWGMAVKHWPRLSKETVVFPSLKTLKIREDTVLSNLL